MFNEKYFSDWLATQKHLSKNVVSSTLSRVRRIDEVYNLLYEYAKDDCEYLVSLFEYSRQDARNGLLPDHDIQLKGDYYTGTMSLKSALKLFIEFQEDDAFIAQCINTKPDEDAAFSEILKSFREMGPITDSDVRKMLAELSGDQNPAPATAATPQSAPPVTAAAPVTFAGNLQAFLRYVGPFCKNYVNSIAKAARTSHNGICEYCGSKAVLDSAHRDGEDRPIIIEKLLEAPFKKAENYYEVDILEFERLFKSAHLPVTDHIFFLCKKCHTEYDKGSKITTADILATRKI